MPSDSQSARRPFHRGRRGHERRAADRRSPSSPSPNQPQEQSPRGDHVDVEHIMRDIRAKIAERHGVELTDQQVEDLAARRLESILDVRTVKPPLLDQLRRSAGARPGTVAAADRAVKPYEFEDTTLYDSPSPFTRFIRKLLNPILKLFFNPNPLIRALNIQSNLNTEAAKREAERDERQTEWNALHYEILQRLVGEVSKVSLEAQSLALRIESLAGKVDFNERRVRGIEGAAQQIRPGGGGGRERDRERDRDREREREREAPPPAASVAAPPVEPPAPPRREPPPRQDGALPAEGAATADAPRRRRRRRRGRRGGSGGEMLPVGAAETADGVEQLDVDDGADAEDDAGFDADPIVTPGAEAVIAHAAPTEAAAAPEPVFDAAPPATFEAPRSAPVEREPASIAQSNPAATANDDIAPERVTPQLSQRNPAAREEAAPDVPTPHDSSADPDPREPQ